MKDEEISHYIEMWKQTIAVQQHFNDIEWRIRGLALTALTFALGAAVVAAREKTVVVLFGWHIQFSSTILMVGLILWLSFYFVDLVWYHQLLIGAVQHGEKLEHALQDDLPKAGLTLQISASSPYHVKIPLMKNRRMFKKPIRSTTKLRIFYRIVATVLILLAVVLQIAA